MTDKDPISNTFNLPQLFGLEPKQEVMSNKTVDDNLGKFANDFDLARSNLVETIQKTNNALAEAIDLATMSQNPRFYEVISALLKTNIEASRELMNTQQQARNIHKSDIINDEGKTVVNNNVLLVATTADLQEILSKAKESKTIKDIDG